MTVIELPVEPLPAACCLRLDDREDQGLGALRTPQGNLPLKLVDLSARVVELTAETTVRQTFVNTLGVPLEATYVFPLPDRHAVAGYRFEVGERVVEGVVQERGQARASYDQALRAGHRASIAEEERPGVFTVRVGNLVPGDEVSVWLELVGPVPCVDGEAELRLPLVVAPRYVPGQALDGPSVGDGTAHDTDAVPDASRISPPTLLPGVPNPVRLSAAVTLDAAPGADDLARVACSLDAAARRLPAGGVRVELTPGQRLDRDLIVRWAVGGPMGAQRTSLVIRRDPASGPVDGALEGTFQLTLLPAAALARGRRPKDVVLLLDRSGSMEGWKMVAARRAAARIVDALGPDDRFSVIAFDDRMEFPRGLQGERLVAGTDRNRFRAVELLAGLEARGGTELAAPLHMAVGELEAARREDQGEGAAGRRDVVRDVVRDGLGSGASSDAGQGADRARPTGRERVLVLVTDGQVGNEDQLLREAGGRLAGIRVFCVGIDQAVNAAFLRRLAGLGGGACELVEGEDRLDEVMDRIHRRIDAPALTDLRLVPEGLEPLAGSVVPARLPDLFPGAPLVVHGRFRARPGARLGLRVEGTDAAGRPWAEALVGRETDARAVTASWARGQVRELEDRYVVLGAEGVRHQAERQALAARIVDTSVRWGVLSRFTAWVAVDREVVVNRGGNVHRVTQAVEQPAGWAKDAPESARRQTLAPGAPPPAAAPQGLLGRVVGALFGAAEAHAPAQAPASSAPRPRPGAGAGTGKREAARDAGDPFAGPTGAGAPFAAPGTAGDPFAAPATVGALAWLAGADDASANAAGGGPAPGAPMFLSQEEAGYDDLAALPPPARSASGPKFAAMAPPPAGAPPSGAASVLGGADPFGAPAAKASPPPLARFAAPPRLSVSRGAPPARKRAGRDEAEPPLDLSGFRERARDLLSRLDEGGRDPAPDALAVALGMFARGLEALVDDLRSVGAPTTVVVPLAELLAELLALRAGAVPGGETLAALAARARLVLETFGRESAPSAPSAPPTPTTQPGRAQFWA